MISIPTELPTVDVAFRPTRPADVSIVVSPSVPYDPALGRPGYEWVTDHQVVIHPAAWRVLEARLAEGRSESARR